MATIRLPALFALLLLVSACSLLPKEKDMTKGWSASKFYSEASSSMAEGDYESAIETYEKLEARFPFGRYATQTQLDVAYAYYRNGDQDQAIAAADRFIKLHPSHPYVDYAFYLKGIVNFNRNMGFFDRFVPVDSSQRDSSASMDSFNDFSELIRRFPQSKYSVDARKRLVFLRNNIAAHQVHAARYYMKRGAYLAAANRCVKVVENYQRTPAIKDALEIMIKAYDKLGLKKLSQDAKRVYAVNESKGYFKAIEEKALEDAPIARQMWDYIGLDKN
ncbi:MAG: outer membrane protein assembly factor BamD [Gammaproteobacteria bacterium]|nr:outer membrane protein assembly factor BamD [Gammaproteobacteria bacterium]